jgi:hypothetical protein
MTKETVSKLRELPIECEKIFASYTYDKLLMTKIYRQLKMVIDTINQNVQEALKIFQDTKNKEYKKTQKQIK